MAVTRINSKRDPNYDYYFSNEVKRRLILAERGKAATYIEAYVDGQEYTERIKKGSKPIAVCSDNVKLTFTEDRIDEAKQRLINYIDCRCDAILYSISAMEK